MAAEGRSYPLSIVVQAIDKITAPLGKIGAAIAATGAKLQGLGAKTRGLADRAGIPMFANAMSRLGGAAKGVYSAFAGIAQGAAKMAAAIGLSAGAVGLLFKNYADLTGAIGDTAERTGASRERIQELGYAAQLSGSSAETLAGALQKMNLAAGKASSGSKDLKEMFSGLQINLKNTNGTMKSTDELFDLFVNRISRIKNPTLQAEAAVKIFGKSATELLPMIRGGNAGIKEMADEARRLGVVISDDAVRSGEEFGDMLDKVAFALKGAGNTILGALVPTLNKLGTQLTETIVKYRPQIEAFAAAFAENLPGYLQQAYLGLLDLKEALAPLGKELLWLSENFGLVKATLIIFATVVTATVVPAIYSMVTATYAFGTALLATPVGWFLAAVAAIAASVYLIYRNWDEFSSFFTDKFDKVKAAFKENFVLGLWSLWKEFNPTSLIIDSLNSLVKFATGIDIAGIIKEKLGIATATAAGGASPNYTAVPKGGAIEAGLANAKANITLDFKNMPTGTTVDSSSSPGVKLQTNQGYSMMAAQP